MVFRYLRVSNHHISNSSHYSRDIHPLVFPLQNPLAYVLKHSPFSLHTVPLTLSNIHEFSHYHILNQNFIAERTVRLVLLSDLILFTARHIQISWSNSLNKHRTHRTFISLLRPSMLEHNLGGNSIYGSFPHYIEFVLRKESVS